MRKDLKYVSVSPCWVEKLERFFKDIVVNKDHVYFHPHPLTYEAAKRIATYEGDDLYFLQIKDNEIAGYAMLRGWDEGYTIPSLGIAIHPNFRNQGLGRDFMEFLHKQAKSKGAAKVRLKVYLGNTGARHFYESLEYSFTNEENSQLIGYCEL
ncbi:MAG: GNAT family N-acetyltransferase [Deltaproteobacteria bacterium]|nr:GNAT family N-acetyltransferase [Deltaproteobacteria bacterium]